MTTDWLNTLLCPAQVTNQLATLSVMWPPAEVCSMLWLIRALPIVTAEVFDWRQAVDAKATSFLEPAGCWSEGRTSTYAASTSVSVRRPSEVGGMQCYLELCMVCGGYTCSHFGHDGCSEHNESLLILKVISLGGVSYIPSGQLVEVEPHTRCPVLAISRT